MESRVKVGDKAPNFNLPDEKKRDRTLKEFLGQKVVLVFFVKAFISTCNKEFCDFRDSISRLVQLNAQIVGIDTNVPSENKALANKNRLSFPILSDCMREVIRKYGLEISGNDGNPIAKRSIFVLDEYGVVRYKWVSEDPTVVPNYKEIEKILESIASEERVAMVAPNVITISRQVGSGGDEIALNVSKILDYAYFDKSLMVSVARSIGVSEEDITDFSEDTYKVKSFVDRLSLHKKPSIIPLALKDIEPLRKTFDEEECLSSIQTVISSLASRGKTVIVGRGGQAILKNKAGVIHVRIIAPAAARVERIMKTEGLNQEAALKLIQENDKAQAEYLRRFYNINWEGPTNYDIVLNTGKMDLNNAARIIALTTSQAWYNMNEIDWLLSETTQTAECLCVDQKKCDIHIDEGGSLVCRHGSNEGLVKNVAVVVCPLEIASERKKWEEFLKQELSQNNT
jgi:peroxiredoxin/cytidylate kinase